MKAEEAYKIYIEKNPPKPPPPVVDVDSWYENMMEIISYCVEEGRGIAWIKTRIIPEGLERLKNDGYEVEAKYFNNGNKDELMVRWSSYEQKKTNVDTKIIKTKPPNPPAIREIPDGSPWVINTVTWSLIGLSLFIISFIIYKLWTAPF